MTVLTVNETELAALREPFPAEQIGKLPRVTCKRCSESPQKVCADHRKERCSVCGGNLTTAHMHLDYVGHAAVTDRLLKVDPHWTWEPMAFDANGAPAVTNVGVMPGEKIGLWIKLTVLGTTRPGFGGGSNMKEAIGDALRNAAMRFGVALDLWSKQDLHERSPQAQEIDEVAAFDPARDRLAHAPQDWRAIGEVIQAIDPTISEWLREATFLLYGSHSVTDLTDAQRAECGVRAANAVARIRDDVMRGNDLPTPTSEELRDVMAWAFGGVVVFPDADGPEEPVTDTDDGPEEATTDGSG